MKDYITFGLVCVGVLSAITAGAYIAYIKARYVCEGEGWICYLLWLGG